MSGWVPTHRVPAAGLDARAAPDPATAPVARLDPGLEVAVAQVWGDWAQVVCANGWWGWVDGRALVPGSAVTPAVPAAPAIPAPAAPAPSGARTGSGGLLADRARAGAIVLAGAAAVALSALLPWLKLGGSSANGFDVPVEFLVSYDSDLDLGVDLGLLLVLLGVAGVALVLLVTDVRWRRGVGAVGVAVALLYVLQVQRALAAGPAEGRPGLLSTVGFGVYVALAGSVLLAWSPSLPRAGEG